MAHVEPGDTKGELQEQKAEYVDGTRILRTGPVAICCMREEARDLLDRAIEQWKREHSGHTEADESATYRAFYWLFRYSGLINYGD